MLYFILGVGYNRLIICNRRIYVNPMDRQVTNMKHNCNIFSILFLLCIFFTAIPQQGFAEKKQQPITIAADEMMSTEKTSQVVFKGDVDAKQGDLRIRTDKMTVFYTLPSEEEKKDDKNVRQQIDKIVCDGNVEITRQDWLGTARKMIYHALKQQIRMSGNAKAWQGQNMVTGEEIIYYIKEKRSEVVGGTTSTIGASGEKKKKRVNMTIIQE